MKYIISIFAWVLCLSCTSVIKEVYGVNKNKEFRNIDEYISYISRQYHFSLKNLYYADDEATYNALAMDIADSHTDFFYGIFINDSTQIKKTDFLKINESCRGRIMNEISIPTDKHADLLQKTITFKGNSFKNSITGQSMDLNTSNRKKIILLFSYKLGSLREKDFKEIEKLLTEKGYDLYIISLDRIHDLKNHPLR